MGMKERANHLLLAGAHALAHERGTSPADIPLHEAEQRGRMIGAASDLLEACEDLLEFATDAKCVVSVKWTLARDRARAAIAKATA